MRSQPTPPWGIDAKGTRGPHSAAPGVSLSWITHARIATLAPFRHRKEECVRDLATHWSLDWPDAGRITTKGALSAAWNGMSDIMLTGPQSEFDLEVLKAQFADRAAIVDQSSGRVLFQLSGAKAQECLMKLVEIDLHPSVFKTGMGALTALHHMSVGVFKRADDPVFLIHCTRSYAADVWHSIGEAGEEYGLVMHTLAHR